MVAQKREQVTLSDVIDELTPEQVRRIVAILGLSKPREYRAPARSKQPAA